MKSILSRLIRPALCSSILLTSYVQAQSMDGSVGLGFATVMHRSADDQFEAATSRRRYSLEFSRMSKNLAVDLTYGNGMGYSDIGANLRINRPIRFGGDEGNFVLIPGIFAGILYSGDGIEIAGDGDEVADQISKFRETMAGPYLRFLYDSRVGVGVSLDFNYEFVFARDYSVESFTDLGGIRKRMSFALTLHLDSNLL